MSRLPLVVAGEQYTQVLAATEVGDAPAILLPTQSSWSRYQLLCARSCFLLTCFFIPLSTTLTDIFFILSALFVLLSGAAWQQKAQLIKLPVVRILLLATAVVLLGLTYTWAPLAEALRYSEKYLWLLLTPLLFVLGAKPLFRSCFIYSFLLAMLITLFFSYLNYFGLTHLYLVKGPDSIFKDHIIQNFLMSITVLISLLQLPLGGWRRIAFSLLFLLAAIDILFLCQGRIGYVLLPILIIYAWMVNYGWRKLFLPILIIGLLFLVALLFSTNLQQRLADTRQNIMNYNFLSLQDSDTSLGIRFAMWDIGGKIIAGHPWLGYGTGSIHAVLNKIPESWVLENEWIRTNRTFESSYLNVSVQFGLIGFVLFIIAGIYLWRQTYVIDDNYYAKLMRGVLIAMAIGFLFNPWLESTTEKHLFALLLVVCFTAIPASRVELQSHFT